VLSRRHTQVGMCRRRVVRTGGEAGAAPLTMVRTVEGLSVLRIGIAARSSAIVSF
jgi:hypothetical protein